MKAVVLISGRGSNLQAILAAIAQQKLSIKLQAVISNRPDALGLTLAQKAGVTTRIVAETPRTSFQFRLREQLDEFSPDLVILAGFMRVLAKETVTDYLGKMVNIHPSLLPKFKGLHTHQRAIEQGETEHGASVHFVTPELDDGPVISQIKLPILPTDTAESLAERLLIREHWLYPKTLQWISEKRVQWIPNGIYFDNELLKQPLIFGDEELND